MHFPRQEIIQLQLLSADQVVVKPGVADNCKSWVSVIMATLDAVYGNTTEAAHILTSMLNCSILEAHDKSGIYVFHVTVRKDAVVDDARCARYLAKAMGIAGASRKTVHDLRREIKGRIL